MLASAKVERIASGFRWAEGPVWFGDMRMLLWSDIPNNAIMRWDEVSGETSVFRYPANYTPACRGPDPCHNWPGSERRWFFR